MAAVKSEVRNITGNRPPDDRSPMSTEEGKRQERAKAIQQEVAKDAPKTTGKGKKAKKFEAFEDPRRYYQGSAYQKKVEELNEQMSSSEDKAEKAKIQKQLNSLAEDVEEQQEEEAEKRETATTRTL